MNRFEDSDVVADIGGRREPKATHEPGTEVGNDVSLKIGEYYDIEILRPDHQFHGQIVDDDIIRLELGVFLRDLLKTFEEESVGEFHDVRLMAAGDAPGAVLLSHLEGVFDDLQAAGPGDKTTAECHVLREHMFDTAIGVFDIFPDNGDIDRDAGPGKHRIDAMQGLKDPLVGI